MKHSVPPHITKTTDLLDAICFDTPLKELVIINPNKAQLRVEIDQKTGIITIDASDSTLSPTATLIPISRMTAGGGIETLSDEESRRILNLPL